VIRIDLTAILIIAALGLTGVRPEGALSGFSRNRQSYWQPCLCSAGRYITPGYRNGWETGSSCSQSFERIILVVMPSVALLSAFTGHVALTAIMLPIILTLARENEIAPSKLLIPMAFAASLGTAIAIIGAPAFLVANGLLRQTGQPPLGIFSIAPILGDTVTGTLFLFAGNSASWPPGDDNSADHFRLEGIIPNCCC
jgi:di/tricarboxylate transporter